MLLLDQAFDPWAQLRQFAAQCEAMGAIASFTGVARGQSHEGQPIDALILESYRGVTLASMQAIAGEARARFALGASLVIHRAGRILPGDPIVLVATAAAHRRAALEGVDFLMDRLKSDAVFWKREEAAGQSRWIEPTQQDLIDKTRWSKPHAGN